VRAPSQKRRSALLALAISTLSAGPVAALSQAPAAATLPSLQQAFDNIGITAPGNSSVGNFDGVGDSYSSAALASDGLVPGASLLHDGLTITWPDVPPASPTTL
jgi:hypothetical protein